jgi:hypothetical protein
MNLPPEYSQPEELVRELEQTKEKSVKRSFYSGVVLCVNSVCALIVLVQSENASRFLTLLIILMSVLMIGYLLKDWCCQLTLPSGNVEEE